MKQQRLEDHKYVALVAENLSKAEAYLARTSPEHDQTRMWAEDNAKRLDALEGQVREQTKEAKRYIDAKCKEMGGRLRIELDTNIPNFMGDLDGRVAGRIQDLEDNLKAWEGQTVTGYFENVGTELDQVKTAMADPIYKQKMLDEAKQMVQDMAQELRNDFNGKDLRLQRQDRMATSVGPAQQKQQDDRISGIEAEIILRLTSRPRA